MDVCGLCGKCLHTFCSSQNHEIHDLQMGQCFSLNCLSLSTYASWKSSLYFNFLLPEKFLSSTCQYEHVSTIFTNVWETNSSLLSNLKMCNKEMYYVIPLFLASWTSGCTTSHWPHDGRNTSYWSRGGEIHKKRKKDNLDLSTQTFTLDFINTLFSRRTHWLRQIRFSKFYWQID